MANAGRAPAPPLKVLIADDSAPVAEMLAQLIADPGRVEVVGSADSQDAAVEAVRRLTPDVVILDLQLKSGSGTDVIRAVRADPALAAVRLLVTSNHVSPQLRTACLQLGADGYYDKVKELMPLAARVAELADGRG
ncbi:MAG TPA: response regulator [Usitatibacter sp.]|jgi:DNA-binding NarL/FixJ family response regulator|nr:response regulator [Usitatibacter sp.]